MKFRLDAPKKAKKENCIVLCGSQEYLWPAAMAARSFVKNASKQSFDIRLVCTEPRQKVLMKYAPKGSFHDHIDLTELANGRSFSPRLTVATYARIFALGDLAGSYRRIVNYDADILVRHGDIAALFDADMKGQPAACVRDANGWRAKPKPRFLRYLHGLGLESGTQYFNAGMLMIDCEKYLEAGITERAVEMLTDHPEKCALHDQSALNHAIAGQWAELSPAWNWQTYGRTSIALSKFFDPHVVHFSGKSKPWNDYIRILPGDFTDPFVELSQETDWNAWQDMNFLKIPPDVHRVNRSLRIHNETSDQALNDWNASSDYLLNTEFTH